MTADAHHDPVTNGPKEEGKWPQRRGQEDANCTSNHMFTFKRSMRFNMKSCILEHLAANSKAQAKSLLCYQPML